MISIADALSDIIKSYPLIEEGLSKGIINYSAFAREVKPQIEKKLYKSVKEGAIVMALKRISEKLPKNGKKMHFSLTDLTVRSNLSEFTFANSETLPEKQKELLNKIASQRDVLFTFTQGIRETTFIASSEITSDIKKIFAAEQMRANIDNLSSITIRLPVEHVYEPGVDYQILKQIAWENINIVEIVSTYTELTIIFDKKDVDRAFSILKDITI